MNRLYALLLAMLCFASAAYAGDMEDDPVLATLIVDKLEMRSADGANPVIWDAEGWIGKDLDKFWFKTEGEYRNEKIEKAEFQGLYSRAISSYWDFQVGARRDTYQSPGTPDRNWLAVGFKGLAPYFFDVDTALFVGEDGRTSLRLVAEYEILLTQQLILVPELEMDFYGKDDPATATGSGLSETELGIRLRYEFTREFAPYIGVNWSKLYGKTADYAKEEGENYDDVQFVVGLRFWF
ncbi:MAG: copper resistance protein CopB [Desulfovibrio sp.]|nr:copper resistance protein CopB [Desulfovibrio sp.]|tara:strand:+ start:194 stop:907 length:714 start_codon:yes stop_codon:yes gene_type:complete